MIKKILAIILLCFMFTSCQKPIDKIFIKGQIAFFWSDNYGEFCWLEADVLQKNGNLWKIKVRNVRPLWFDITNSEIEWRTFYQKEKKND